MIGAIALAPLMYFYLAWTVHLGINVLRRARGAVYVGCGGPTVRLLDSFNGCGTTQFHTTYAVVEVLAFTAIAALAVYGVARWVVHPISQLADTLGSFGPNALGLRLRASGPRDETRRLSDTVDAMLDRLAEGYEAQRRFASSASHELRTPLATQRALIEVSLDRALTEDQLALLTRQLLATNERNEKLIDGLLTLAETERGVMATSVLRLDLIVEAVVRSHRPTAEERGVRLEAELHPLTVHGEEPLLERLVSNLVDNAIKYNERGGTVVVTVSGDGALVVCNSGPTVPPESTAGLFEPFRRLAGERLDHGGGVGLGLTIARSIVAAHGGAVDAEANPNGGLTVGVRLRPVAA